MKAIDRWLQRHRARVAGRWIPDGVRLLDIGCHQGEWLASLAPRLRCGVGIDPLAPPRTAGNLRLYRGEFPSDALRGEFDVITLLAVLEHLDDLPRVAERCRALLAPGGRIVVTVPSRAVDRILWVLRALRLIDGMSLEQHHGFHAADTVAIFEHEGLDCVWRRRFQCGLNHVYVFQRGVSSVWRASGAAERERGECVPTGMSIVSGADHATENER